MSDKTIKKDRLSPILKWAGGKEQELKHIHPNMPNNIKNYHEPFVGGGAVFFSLQADEMFINDKSHELVGLYRSVSSRDKKFFDIVEKMIEGWEKLEEILHSYEDTFIHDYKGFSSGDVSIAYLSDKIDLLVDMHAVVFKEIVTFEIDTNTNNFLKEIKKNVISKATRMRKLESTKGLLPNKDILDNIESALKSAFYMHVRYLYNNINEHGLNNSFATAIFFFIRNYAYSGMFRYNKSGGFNVPYGGIGYNRKNLTKKVDYLKSNELVQHLAKTTIDNLDFEEFFKKNKPKKDDFIFLDPPYDSEFSTYAQNEFTKDDQTRLANYLLDDCKANWMMIIKHTDFIFSLYNRADINISAFDKKYLVSFKNRNNNDAQHLVITNYVVSEAKR